MAYQEEVINIQAKYAVGIKANHCGNPVKYGTGNRMIASAIT
jgi:hypothetical protein